VIEFNDMNCNKYYIEGSNYDYTIMTSFVIGISLIYFDDSNCNRYYIEISN